MAQVLAEQSVRVASQLSTPLGARTRQVYQQNARFVNRYGRWFLMTWLAALVDGKMMLAIALSLLTYHLIKTGQSLPWEKVECLCEALRTQMRQMSRHPLGASALAFAGMYSLAAAWSELGSGWAATTLTGLGLLNIVLLINDAQPHRPSAPDALGENAHPETESQPLEPHWQNLSAPSPLKRLLAVRALLHWSLSTEAGRETYLPGTAVTMRSHLIDCFRVMLTHESEPLVRVALLDGLKALQPKPQLAAGQPALEGLVARPTAIEVQRSVEYVEP